jgi:hypothetical protein
MKLPFPISHFQLPIVSRQVKPGPHHAPRNTQHAPRNTLHSGVALVITLVLLSVITFMAVTFLVVSRSQHGAVATETDQQIARFAADTARERAIADLLAPILAATNEFNYGLRVSTNYINSAGFDQTLPAPGPVNPTNVNYDYTRAGIPLTLNQQLQNLANLLYNPRAPVFIVTNAAAVHSNEFRFYLDLNRNGAYDPNGLQPWIVRPNPPSGPLYFYGLSGDLVPYSWPPPPNILSNFFVGDPEWIGGLQRPEFAHSATNLFTHRYAYLVVPAGQTLDINVIHNDGKQLNMNREGDGFLRNQGILTAEMNLAAFLADLNTNMWPGPGSASTAVEYEYYPTSLTVANRGYAFDDASALLSHRYAGNWNTLASVAGGSAVGALYPVNGAAAFNSSFDDAYCEGPVMTGTSWTPPNNFNTRVKYSWTGADNQNRFYTTQDLFDQSKTRPSWLPPRSFSFSDRLWMAGTNVDSYNRYTFYRLLSQLGTDSALEPGGDGNAKMNLNYCNVDNNGYVVPHTVTNFIPWSPAQFFTNAAIRLLADAGYTAGAASSTSNLLVTNVVGGILVTNLHIPIWPTNYYTPSVHRLMQLAANMYDATTNRNFGLPAVTNGYPTIFRPYFLDQRGAGKLGGMYSPVFINGYVESANSTEINDLISAYPLPHDLNDPNDTRINPNPYAMPPAMVYGIPLVIGAKKGYPNFNELGMYTQVQVTRKLQFHRQNGATNTPINELDQMFLVGVSNVFGVELWNSYSTAFPRPLQMVVYPDISVLMTNLDTLKQLIPAPTRYQPPTTTLGPQFINVNNWPGYNPTYYSNSFVTPLMNGSLPYTNIQFLTNSTYRSPKYGDQFVPVSTLFERTLGTTNLHVPHWQLQLKVRLRVALFDPAAKRIVDYVNLADGNSLDITTNLFSDVQCGSFYTPNGSPGSMWCTNRQTGATDSAPTFGIMNQIAASQRLSLPGLVWNPANNDFPPGMAKSDAIAFFQGQLLPIGSYPNTAGSFNAPYQPVRTLFLLTSWQANDPLVHYTVGDLIVQQPNVVLDQFGSTPPNPTVNLGQINGRYEPWGGNPLKTTGVIPPYDLTAKDPVMLSSDYWDFPTNKYPNVGWLGRVHRGTPWQTVYLKQPGIDFSLGLWQTWTGNTNTVINFGQLSTNVLPLYVPGTLIGVGNDAYFTEPVNDWRLLDLFTAAVNDNATRGQLSINLLSSTNAAWSPSPPWLGNLAAWSAALSGVVALTNTLDASGHWVLSPTVIEPAGIYNPFDTNTWPPLVQLVKRINDIRATNNTIRPVFDHLSDLLAVPELTANSPFLNLSGTPSLFNSGLNDEAYERLPQQIAGLLKCDHTPRFVIYAFGQTLKPESTRAIIKSGPYAGLCTNYQIVAEAATRTVVRFEGVQPNHGTNAITSLHPVIESFNVLPPD